MAGTPIIRQAGKDKQQVKIQYTNRQGKSITRTIRPYEIRGGYLYATDTVHGAGHIHSFKVSRIKSAEPVERKYKPNWPVKL
jgi:predicted DNA-binding transcriptional regulator YafY